MSDANERSEAALDTKNTVHASDSSREGKPVAEDANLLEQEAPEAAKAMLKDWDDSWKTIKKFSEEWKVNKARAAGYIGVQLIKKQDQSQAYIPTGAKKSVAGMNKAKRLMRRLRAVMFSDPPMAEAMPSGDDDDERDAAETSTRVLADLTSEGNLAYTLHSGDAFDLGGIYGSGFIRFWVDEMGGGWKPKQIEALPQATSADDPRMTNPETGQPSPGDPILRYVTPDGAFTDDPAEAEKQWFPKLKDEVLTGKQVRFLPTDVRDLWEADGVMIGTAITLGELERMFPELRRWDEERRTRLVQARPQHFKDILEPHQKDAPASETTAKSLVFVLTRYHSQSATYEKGAYLIAAGEDEMLHRSTWFDETHVEPLDIPLTQFKQFTDEGNPYGEGVMTNLGPGNEVRGSLLGAMLEHLRRFQNRHIFVPITSPIMGQPQMLQTPTGTPIPMLPGGEPKYEQLPDFPIIVEKMEKLVSADMDDESGLQQVGQAQAPTNVKSALHANVIMQQVQVGLSDLRQNTERALIRGWRVMLQLVRAYYTTPQQISWLGDDGRYKQRAWAAADLGGTHEVRLQRGSFTMLSPTSKAELAQHFREQGLLQPAELEHVVETNVGGLFGLQDNPHRLRVRRQIATWNDGPKQPPVMPQMPMLPPPMAPQPQRPPQSPQGPGMAPLTAPVAPGAAKPGLAGPSRPPMPQGPPQPPPDPWAQNPFGAELKVIFKPVPADDEPQVAALRVYEIGRAMASTKFHKWPEPWQQGLVMAYGQARGSAQMPDAKMLQGLQQKLKETSDELLKAKVKLNAASVSFSAKLTDLDAQQTQAILAAEGINVPPRAQPDPGSLQHEQALKGMEVQTELEKHKLSLQADMAKTQIQTAAKARDAEANRAHQVRVLRSQKAPVGRAGRR